MMILPQPITCPSARRSRRVCLQTPLVALSAAFVRLIRTCRPARPLHLLAALFIVWPQLFHPIHLAIAHGGDACHDNDCHDHCVHEHQVAYEVFFDETSKTPCDATCVVARCTLCVAFKISGGQKYERPDDECAIVIANTQNAVPVFVQNAISIDTFPLCGPRAPPRLFVS